MNCTAGKVLVLAGMILLCGLPAKADSVGEDFDLPSVGGYWTLRTSYYNSPWDSTPAGTVSGGQLHIAVPTNNNYRIHYLRIYETNNVSGVSGHDYYSGALLGDISGQAAVESRLRLVTDNLPDGQAFIVSNFQTYAGEPPYIRIMMVRHGITAVPYGTGDQTQYAYWFSAPLMLTDLSNKDYFTFTASLDPAVWTSWFGQPGTYDASSLAGFNAALADMGRIGFAFGSGAVANSGWAYNAGIAGSLEIDYFHTVAKPTCPSADLTEDCFVGMEDFASLALLWLGNDCVTPGWCGGADFNKSGAVDLADLTELAGQWLTGLTPEK